MYDFTHLSSGTPGEILNGGLSLFNGEDFQNQFVVLNITVQVLNLQLL
jgi:hypothetical protein